MAFAASFGKRFSDALVSSTNFAGNAPAFAGVYAAGRPIATEATAIFAEGLVCREPQAEQLE
jgi:hypothetical protein